MKNSLRLSVLVALALCMGVSTSCMTTYDANGNPVQSVDPGMAVAGAAAAGLVGYAVGQNNGSNYYYGGPPVYYGGGGRYYRGGGYNGYRGGGRRGGYHP